MIIFQLICIAFAVERTVEIIVDSKIFAPLRNFIAHRAIPEDGASANPIWKFLYDLTSCGYCLSVHVAIFYTIFFRIRYVQSDIVNFLVNVMVLHGLSNLLHVVYMIIYRGQVKYVHVTMKDEEDGL